MDQDRWKTINQIFHAALEISSSERHAFVLSASNGDHDLLAEVELLLQADQDAGSYLETPLLATDEFSNATPPLSPGDVLCGRFRILRAVGEGGMGHVFEAYDSELTVHVALKIIRPEIASNAEALSRFRQEVRLARRITHPNVCRTFDIEREIRVLDSVGDTKQEIIFLTMEFLEGETLASRIKRTGPLQLDEALQVGRQVADAMNAAHSLGIVHRDLKPANIMLVPAESAAELVFRAVITDFGLARLDTALPQGNRSVLSNSGRPIGTLAYMAPEQLEGTAVSAATDIYAFGLILFEMVTGTRAFPSDNFLSGIARRVSGPPPSPQTIVPTLPIPWCRAIEGCLSLKPEDRFQAVADATAILEGGRIDFPRTNKPSLVQRLALASWPPRRRLYTASAIFVAAVSLFLGSLRLYQSRADAKVAPGALVYLTQVKNETGEKTFDNLTELIQASLAQSAQINLLDQSRVGDTLQHMTKAPDTVIDPPTAREIALRTGAVRVVFCRVSGSQGSYNLNIDLQQPDASSPARYRDRWTQSFAWQSSGSSNTATIPQELTSTVRKASNWIRAAAGESKNDIATLDTPPEDVTTNSWAALIEYNNARLFSSRGEPASAVLALQHAVLIDPQFALAYGQLGDTLAALYRTPEAYEAYRNALNINQDWRLTRRERDRIKGMYAADSGDMEAAEVAFRDYSTYFENDPAGWAYRSYPLEMLGRIDEAISVLERAAAFEPHRSFPMNELITCLLSLGRYDEARQWIARLRTEGYSDYALLKEGQLHFLLGEYDQAARSFRSVSTSDSQTFRESGNSMLARLEAEQGNDFAATQSLNRDIDHERSNSNHSALAASLLDRAYLYGKHGEIEGCNEDIEQAIGLNPSVQNTINASRILGEANFLTHGVHSADISKTLRKLAGQLSSSETSTIFDIARLRVNGELMLAQGNWKQALLDFSQVDKLDAPSATREYLARALATAAGRQPTYAMREEFGMKAIKAYETVTLREGFIWSQPTNFPPGFYADHVAESLRLPGLSNLLAEVSQQAFARYKQLRPDESTSSLSVQLPIEKKPRARSNQPTHKGELQ